MAHALRHSCWGRWTARTLLVLLLAGLSSFWLLGTPPALANLNDDRFDGNIFALYAGNGALVPARTTLKESLRQKRPAIVVFYVDDSRDCKQFSPVVSQLDAFYGRAASLIPVIADSVSPGLNYSPKEPGYYFKGAVPQTVVLDQEGKVVFDETGNVAFEQIDDVLRKVFKLLPRSESVELKRRPVNEINTELVPE